MWPRRIWSLEPERAQEMPKGVDPLLLMTRKWPLWRSSSNSKGSETVTNSRLFAGTRRQVALLSLPRGGSSLQGGPWLRRHDDGRGISLDSHPPERQCLQGFHGSTAGDTYRSHREGWRVIRLKKEAVLARLQPQDQWSGESTPRSARAWKHSGSFESCPLIDRQQFDQKCGTAQNKSLYNSISIEKGG